MRLGEAAKLALLSFDSTLRSNLSVGLPIDLLIYERDCLDVRRQKRIEQDDEYFRKLSAAWSDALRTAFCEDRGVQSLGRGQLCCSVPVQCCLRIEQHLPIGHAPPPRTTPVAHRSTAFLDWHRSCELFP